MPTLVRHLRNDACIRKYYKMKLKNIKTVLATLCVAAMPLFVSAQTTADGGKSDEIDNYDFLYTSDGSVNDYDVASMDNLMDEAFSLIGTRYRAGSSSPSGFDCSGFTSYLYRQMGIELNRSSRGQYAQGEAVEESELRTGDLVFFTSPRSGKSIGHVGIVVDYDPMNGNFSFIHASTTGVRVSQSNEPFYSRRYVGARRISQ